MNQVKAKKKFEAIFPLTAMQKAFLFHHILEENDKGLLQVELTINGNLNIDFFKEAWQKTVKRHTVLRTSVHWQKIEKAVQIIHHEAVMPVEIRDLSNLKASLFEKEISQLKRPKSLNLSVAPVSKIQLIRKSESGWIMLWTCHHLLLDGWSAANIIKDIFACYEGLCENTPTKLSPIPSFKNYYTWLQQQNKIEAKTFWKNSLKDLNEPNIFNAKTIKSDSFKDYLGTISETTANQLKKYAQQQQITIGTFIKGIWGILLSKYAQREIVSFGTTVSGRSSTIPNIESMTGLFINVLPVQLELKPDALFSDRLRVIQKEQAETINFEHNTHNQILNWINAKQGSLFDNIVVFENFPWKNIQCAGLSVEGFKGGFTTTYPLTLIIIPGSEMIFKLRYNTDAISQKTVKWFASQLKKLISYGIKNPNLSIRDLLNQIENAPGKKKSKKLTREQNHSIDVSKNYHPPSNKTELQLTKIWEQVLGFSPISTTDNFFEIGGKSLHAVQVLNLIEQKLGHNLPPVTLIKNPTVQSLSKSISDENISAEWSSLLPLKSTGSKPPLFCIHAGGGHTFFYNTLIKYLDKEQPVYSIQPLGFKDGEQLPKSMDEMATNYLKEITEAAGNAPIIILAYCFSMAVAIEMSRQLQDTGKPAPMLIVVDSSPRVPNPNPIPTTKQRIQRLFNLSFQEIVTAISAKMNWRLEQLKNKWNLLTETKQEKVLRKIQENLSRLYDEYQWRPFNGKMTYIRSTEFTYVRGKDDHVKEWKSLAKDGLDIYITEGHHETLFKEPEVQGLAKQLQKCLDDAFEEK